MSDLENELRQALGPVTAPADLWARVDLSTQPRGVSRWPFQRLALAAAVALPLLAAGGLFYLRAVERQPAGAPLAQTALAIHNQGDAVLPADGVQVRRFEVDGTPATLVSLEAPPAPSAPAAKQVRQSQTASGLTVFEWTQQGRRFALVAARQTGRNACRLCHAV